jgi:hypothetical protein
MPLASPSTTHHAAPSPSNRTGLAVAALVFGVLTVGIALWVETVGVFLPYAWFAVLALAVLTLVCGLLSVGRKHHNSSLGGVLAWIGVIGGIVALVLGVWGTTEVLRDHHTGAASPVKVLPIQTAHKPTPPTTPALSGTVLQLGQTYVVDNVTVNITGPVQYTPAGLPQVTDGSTLVRAVEFTATITNNTAAPLLANGVDIEGLVAGQTVGHVYDDNVRALAADIQPGQTTTYPVAFNLPQAPTQLTLQVNPQAMNSTDKVYYQGTV